MMPEQQVVRAGRLPPFPSPKARGAALENQQLQGLQMTNDPVLRDRRTE